MTKGQRDAAVKKRAASFQRAVKAYPVRPERLLCQLLDAKEAAALLSKSESAIRRMTFRRELPVVRLGSTVRYRLLDLLAMIEEQSEPVFDLDRRPSSVDDPSLS
jgi:predicted DNA-binding transcriptional regulator AlpA